MNWQPGTPVMYEIHDKRRGTHRVAATVVRYAAGRVRIRYQQPNGATTEATVRPYNLKPIA